MCPERSLKTNEKDLEDGKFFLATNVRNVALGTDHRSLITSDIVDGLFS